MSDCEDTVFVECADGVANYHANDAVNERELSVEVIRHNSSDGETTDKDTNCEREDIVQAAEAVKRVKDAIQYHDDQSFQEALDKVKSYARIDAEFEEKITMLKRIRDTDNYAPFRESVKEALEKLIAAQQLAQEGKTTLSRPIEILNEVLPVFEKACSVYTEKVESSPKVRQILMQLDEIRLEITKCEQIEIGDVEKAKKLERKGEKLLEEAVKHSSEDVARIEGKIKEEEEAGILVWFESTKTETNKKMDYLTEDFEQMKKDCADDIQLTERTLSIEVKSKEQAYGKFLAKDAELQQEIAVEIEKEEELKRRLQEVRDHRRKLEDDRELRTAVQEKADVVHEQAENDLQNLLSNLNDLQTKVDTANIVLKQTRDVCNMLFNKAVESKNMQNQDLENVLMLSKKSKHNALIAHGVNCLNIHDREHGTIDMLKDKIKKKQVKLQDFLKRHLEDDVKKTSGKIKNMKADLELSKKNLVKVDEKLQMLKQEIAAVQQDLDTFGTHYVTLDQAYTEFKKHNEGDDGFSLPSLP